MSTRIRQITVLGHDVRVSVQTGTGSGRPLVLCNGIGASLDLLEPFVDELDPSIDIVSFDVPGVGGSSKPMFPYTFAMLAYFVGKMMDQLGYESIDVLGISWGGGLAQQLAIQNPCRVRRLILVSTGTGMLMIPGNPRVLSKMVTPRRYRDPAYAKAIAAELYGGQMRAQPEMAKPLLHDHLRVGSGRGYLFQMIAGAGWTSLPFLPFLRQKTLILAGSDDPIIPIVNAKIMNYLIPNSALHVYDDGHLGLLTKADELAPLVSTFLQ